MFSIEQANDDTEKPGYFGHTVRIGLFRASEQLPPLGAPETHSISQRHGVKLTL